VVRASAEIPLALKDHPEVDIQASSRAQHHWQSLAVAVEHLQVTQLVELPVAVVVQIRMVRLLQIQPCLVRAEQLLRAEQRLLHAQPMDLNTQVVMVVVEALKQVAVEALVITVAVEVTQTVLQMVEAEAVPDISTQLEVH
jgi:hypothetical protein